MALDMFLYVTGFGILALVACYIWGYLAAKNEDRKDAKAEELKMCETALSAMEKKDPKP